MALVEQAKQPLPNERVLSLLKSLRDDLRQMIDYTTSATAATPASPVEWAAPLRHRFTRIFDELEVDSEWRIAEHWLEPQLRPNALQSLNLTRLAEEALTNVIKHSRAQRVCVFLEQTSRQELTLRITDDGVGFDVHSTQANGMGVGMRSMQARVERINGTLTVESSTGTTVLLARLLLSERTGASAETPSGSMPLQP